jgi:hypothetical protein
VARTEVPGPHSPCDLSIVEAEIHSGANGVELRPAGKCNLLNLLSFEEQATFAAFCPIFLNH